MTTLDKVDIGKKVEVISINGEKAIKRRIMDMGIIKGSEIFIRKVAPLGDPLELTVRNYELSIRMSDAANINVKEIWGEIYENSFSWKS